MILCYANLLCVDVDPITMATAMTVEQARELLLRTQDSLEDARWKGASLLGTGFRQVDDDPRDQGLYWNVHMRAGVELSIAPIGGLGWAHGAGTMGGEWREFPRRFADERAFVETVGAYCREIHGLSVVAETDAVGEWQESFETSLRRRIAYALGYHASLRAGSRDCYEALHEPLIVGTVEQLDELTAGGDELERFSIVLNLLARLLRTRAYEKRHGTSSPDAPGKLRLTREKVALLDGRLNAVSKQLEGQLNVDGRIALRSLRRELDADRERGAWNGDPIWGSRRPRM